MDADIGAAVTGATVTGATVTGATVTGATVIDEDEGVIGEGEGLDRIISVITVLSRGVSTSEMDPFGLTYKTVGTPVTGFSDPIGVFW